MPYGGSITSVQAQNQVATLITAIIYKEVTDTSSGTDLGFLEGQIPFTEAGTGLDDSELEGQPIGLDVGAGIDALALEAQLTVLEACAGVDSYSITVTFTVSDVGSGTDLATAFAGEVLVEIFDDGVAVDLSQIEAQITPVETASGSDIFLSISFTVTDAGTSQEVTVFSITFLLSDVGNGTDEVPIEAQITLPDSGESVEVPGLEGQIPSADSGTAVDLTVSISFSLSDSVTGADAWNLEAQINPTDSGSGVEATVTIGVSFSVSDTGAAADLPAITCTATLTDSGSAVDSWQYPSVTLTVADSLAGADLISLSASFTISDVGVGADVWTVDYCGNPYILESGAGTELFSKAFNILETVFGVEISYRVQDTLTIDDFTLPHVRTIRISEPTVMPTKPITDALPHRGFVGKKGRTIMVEGWTDSLSELEQIRGLNDGETHLLFLPTGDSLSVWVNVAAPAYKVQAYAIYQYSLTLTECLEGDFD